MRLFNRYYIIFFLNLFVKIRFNFELKSPKGFYIKLHVDYIRYFDLLKGFGYIERVVKYEKKNFGEDLFYTKRAKHALSYLLI